MLEEGAEIPGSLSPSLQNPRVPPTTDHSTFLSAEAQVYFAIHANAAAPDSLKAAFLSACGHIKFGGNQRNPFQDDGASFTL